MRAYVFFVKYAVRPVRKTKIVWILSSAKQGNNGSFKVGSTSNLKSVGFFLLLSSNNICVILWKFIFDNSYVQGGLVLLRCAIGFAAECPLPTVELYVPNKCMIEKKERVVSGSWFIEVFVFVSYYL